MRNECNLQMDGNARCHDTNGWVGWNGIKKKEQQGRLSSVYTSTSECLLQMGDDVALCFDLILLLVQMELQVRDFYYTTRENGCLYVVLRMDAHHQTYCLFFLSLLDLI